MADAERLFRLIGLRKDHNKILNQLQSLRKPKGQLAATMGLVRQLGRWYSDMVMEKHRRQRRSDPQWLQKTQREIARDEKKRKPPKPTYGDTANQWLLQRDIIHLRLTRDAQMAAHILPDFRAQVQKGFLEIYREAFKKLKTDEILYVPANTGELRESVVQSFQLYKNQNLLLRGPPPRCLSCSPTDTRMARY